MIFDINKLVKETCIELYGQFSPFFFPYDSNSRNLILDKINTYSNHSIYSRKYELLTNIVKPRGFEIHHIDYNRNNNHINNLVLLPTKEHRKYHCIVSNILSFAKSELNDGILYDTKLYNSDQIDFDPYNKIEMFQDFKYISEICNKWVILRDYIFKLSSSIDNFNGDYKAIYKENGFYVDINKLKYKRP